MQDTVTRCEDGRFRVLCPVWKGLKCCSESASHATSIILTMVHVPSIPIRFFWKHWWIGDCKKSWSPIWQEMSVPWYHDITSSWQQIIAFLRTWLPEGILPWGLGLLRKLKNRNRKTMCCGRLKFEVKDRRSPPLLQTNLIAYLFGETKQNWHDSRAALTPHIRASCRARRRPRWWFRCHTACRCVHRTWAPLCPPAHCVLLPDAPVSAALTLGFSDLSNRCNFHHLTNISLFS